MSIRLITAQARLGLVSGKIDGLAADAIEGLTFDQCGPLAPRVDNMPQEDKVPAEADESAISSARTDATAGLPGSAPGGDQAPPSTEQVPASAGSADTREEPTSTKPRRIISEEDANHVNFVHRLTAEDQRLQRLDELQQAGAFLTPVEQHRLWAFEAYCSPNSCTLTNPLPWDCSARHEYLLPITQLAAAAMNKNDGTTASYDTSAPAGCDDAASANRVLQPLLTALESSSVTELKLTPDKSGVAIALDPAAPQTVAAEKAPRLEEHQEAGPMKPAS